ncbi:MAG: ATP-binding cassette domain-containing protein [Thermoleophilia bacterium]|nr:ATP-binding cassette domain-containing protein [Thermoleophilia bacterium]
MALATVEGLTFAYPGAARPALTGISLELAAGEVVALLGPSGAGKSTLLRALAGLVPHFHGGSFRGRVLVAGYDTRRARPADLAGAVATVFQDPEDQVVMASVENEVAFGLENVATPPAGIAARVEEALAAVGAVHLAGRRTTELSGGELQRVCLASALALRPRLLLLDEPTSQLDPEAADAFLDAVAGLGAAAVLSEQRTARALALADRVLFVDGGELLLDAPRAQALAWLAANRPAFLPPPEPASDVPSGHGPGPGPLTWPEGTLALEVAGVSFAYDRVPVLDGVSLAVARGEGVVLEGPNGCGKTTLAKLACGLLEPVTGSVRRAGRACYLSQDPGRYLVRERADEEVALAVGGDLGRARAALATVGLEWAASRHPRDLSSGERERLGLAAVAVAEPDLLVLDEPTRGIDPERKEALAGWLAAFAARGHGVLVASHDRSFPCHRRVSLTTGETVRV